MSSDANLAYLQFLSQFGQPPKRAGQLIKFANQNGVTLSWKQAKTLLANPPITRQATDIILINTRKRNTWNLRPSSTSDASPIHNAWNLQSKIDPMSGQQYTSSQGLPPPPPNNHTNEASQGFPPPPAPPTTAGIWTHENKNDDAQKRKRITHKNRHKHKKVSSRGVPPPPGHIDIWAVKQSHSPLPTSSPILGQFASHNSFVAHHNNHKSMTSPQIHNQFISYMRRHSKHSKHKQSSSMSHFAQKRKKYQHRRPELDIDALMRRIDKKAKQIDMISSIVPKLYEAQQHCHRFMTELSNQCISTFIAPAVLGDQFSNPDDPFAEFLHCMGLELHKFQSIESKYLSVMRQKFVLNIEKVNVASFDKVRTYYSNYRQLQKGKECADNAKNESLFFELSLLKLKLQNEMNAVQKQTNVALLTDIDLYWKSYRNLLKAKANILLQSKMRTQSMDAWHSDADEEDNYFSQWQNAQLLSIDIDAIDQRVGFKNIYNDIVKYPVKLGKNKQCKRVIYVDKTNKIIKILTLKTQIRSYAFHEIDKIEKEYNLSDMNRLSLRFNDNKQYFYEFESARKREEFTGELLEYGKNNINQKLLSIFVGSWNVGDSDFDAANISNWISKDSKHDLYIIGLQEVKSKLKSKWVHGLLAYIDDGDECKILNKTFLNTGFV